MTRSLSPPDGLGTIDGRQARLAQAGHALVPSQGDGPEDPVSSEVHVTVQGRRNAFEGAA